jgi:hypothetical protein
MLAVRIILGLVATVLVGVGLIGAGLVAIYALVLTGRAPRPMSLMGFGTVLLIGLILQLLVTL